MLGVESRHQAQQAVGAHLACIDVIIAQMRVFALHQPAQLMALGAAEGVLAANGVDVLHLRDEARNQLHLFFKLYGHTLYCEVVALAQFHVGDAVATPQHVAVYHAVFGACIHVACHQKHRDAGLHAVNVVGKQCRVAANKHHHLGVGSFEAMMKNHAQRVVLNFAAHSHHGQIQALHFPIANLLVNSLFHLSCDTCTPAIEWRIGRHHQCIAAVFGLANRLMRHCCMARQ